MPGATPTPRCPRCGYDLSGVAADAGACPECGADYSRARLARQSEALTRLALNLTVFGAAALLVGFALGQCISAMPTPTQGNPGQAGAATLLLTLLPAALFSLGLSILAMRTGRTVLSCGWPAAASVLYTGSIVFGVASLDNSFGTYASAPPLLQVGGWTPLNAWVLRVSQSLAFIGAAAVLGRLAGALDARAVRRALTLCIVLGATAGAMHLVTLLREFRSGMRGASDDIIDNWIVVATAMLALSAALGVVGAGLVVRNQWLAGRPDDPCGPAPPRIP